MENIKIINIIGPYPPPYGGISVHIKRIYNYLKNNNYEVKIYNESKTFFNEDVKIIKSYKTFLLKLFFIKGDIFHFHTIDKKIRMLLGIYKLFNKKIILTIHGESLNNQINDSNFFIRFLLINSLKKLDKIICVNPKIVDELVNLGFNKNKLIYLPAYINPMEEEKDYKNISKEVYSFISKSKFLLCANGWIRFNKNQDLYGIDIMIELINKLKNNNYKVNLIIALLGCESLNDREKEHYNYIKMLINKYNLKQEIFLMEVKDTEFYPILKQSHLFLRPTNTDGYGVSIAEALYFKIPAIASDVCKRPEGTILFKNRDIDDLYEKTVDVIENYKQYKNNLINYTQHDYSQDLLLLYNQMINQ
ncbi:glycosyltransferase family 4 protein [Caloramator sp. E03]|uniref:glycosyltransferase family 4 protein n=1 Tax=Caloramator sp. E03 TaxID=2576307 RepID=UPI00143DBE90|nr:glycosyltransferase family 4 protein [Caloramator sp. E03]